MPLYSGSLSFWLSPSRPDIGLCPIYSSRLQRLDIKLITNRKSVSLNRMNRLQRMKKNLEDYIEYYSAFHKLEKAYNKGVKEFEEKVREYGEEYTKKWKNIENEYDQAQYQYVGRSETILGEIEDYDGEVDDEYEQAAEAVRNLIQR